MNAELAARLTSGPFWQLVRPAMGADEQPVHHAHLNRVRGTDKMSGTLFLTSHQLLWRSVDPSDPSGSEFETPLTDVINVEQPQRFAAFHAFRVVTGEQTRPIDTFFFPRRSNDVERLLCVQMYGLVQKAWDDGRRMRHTA
jgi:hypothetical protein